MVKELRRQVQAEKRRAEQAEKQLEEVLGMHDTTGLLSQRKTLYRTFILGAVSECRYI